MEEENNKKSRNIGLIATTVFHGIVALLFFILMAWTAPDPPLPEYGVEINLGFQAEGSGEVQSDVDPGNEGAQEESASQPEETKQPEVKEEATESQPEKAVVTDETNPVSVKTEEKKEVKEEVKTEAKKEVKPTETKKPEVKKETVFTPNETTDKNATQKKGENKSEGDDKNATGNKGQTDGTLDPNAQYSGIKGGGGGGNGTGLAIDGWDWNSVPKPILPSNDRGEMVYEIKVDEDGELIRIEPLKILSAEADRICRAEIAKLTFTAKGTPKAATGKITFVFTAGKQP